MTKDVHQHGGHGHHHHTAHGTPAQETTQDAALDPVCGMTVAIAGARETFVHDGRTYYFCGPGCRSRFEADPARYLAVA